MNTDTFLHTDMSGKVIHKATFKDIPENDIIACFKVMPRLQVCLFYFNLYMV